MYYSRAHLSVAIFAAMLYDSTTSEPPEHTFVGEDEKKIITVYNIIRVYVYTGRVHIKGLGCMCVYILHVYIYPRISHISIRTLEMVTRYSPRLLMK